MSTWKETEDVVVKSPTGKCLLSITRRDKKNRVTSQLGCANYDR